MTANPSGAGADPGVPHLDELNELAELVAVQVEQHIEHARKTGKQPSKSQMEWMRSWPQFIRDGEPHPWYGPCDGIGPNGECSECGKTQFKSVEEWETWLRSDVPICSRCGQVWPDDVPQKPEDPAAATRAVERSEKPKDE